ncbi:MAG: substrate-binding domain-containing protein [Ardenticatenaceae bacterium]|nr:substrate-binding domain-containing protein [Ardenticatenaceae bacterium]MCB9443854.1 substrate-binding domain-containing protein [Ardenticatenaceae bacterium]
MLNNETKITILDIAEKANVSPSTVSRVLRNSAGVAQKKRDAVMQAVTELDYRPNIFAQSLASGQSMTIGVLTQNFGSPFYDGILQGILQGLEGTDYWPLFADGRWQPAIEQQALDLLLDRRVDGIIVLGGQTTEERLQRIAANIPLVVVARELKMMPEHCLYVDNFQAAYRATKYLLEMGHRDIAHITAPVVYQESVDDIFKRYQGYQQALRDMGFEPDPRLVVEGNLQQQSGVLAVEMLLSRGRPFSAIFSANDQMSFGARLALFRRGIRVPEDVSLIGFDDEASAAYMVPPLTTSRQPSVEMGQAAAQAILDLMNGKTPTLPCFQAHLIVRESVSRRR